MRGLLVSVLFADMHVKLSKQVLLSANSIAGIYGECKKLSLTLRAARHRGYVPCVSQDHEATLWHIGGNLITGRARRLSPTAHTLPEPLERASGYEAATKKPAKGLWLTPWRSSITWDKPFYKCRVLHPIAWVLERLISTPATHHAHHAATTDDGVGYYKGNFGNMFFLWDVIFRTAHISRQYPAAYGISHYEKDPWYAQFLWPVFKSKVEGSELAGDGPMVKVDAPWKSPPTPTSSAVTQEAA